MPNRRVFEYFVLAMAIGLGVPIFAVFGSLRGEADAALAYPPPPEAMISLEVDYAQVVRPSEAAIEKGRKIFAGTCAACHGAEADGQGPAAGALKPPPRNFLDAEAKYTRGRTPLDLYATLTEGNPGTAMPGFSASLSVEDRWAVVHYLGTLRGLEGDAQPLDAAAAAAWRP